MKPFKAAVTESSSSHQVSQQSSTNTISVTAAQAALSKLGATENSDSH